MSSLTISYGHGKIKIDNFYKSLLFQKIMDEDFNRNERDILLVIFRKTLHFEKWKDNLGMYSFSQSVGICDKTLRQTIIQLEAKGLIEIEKSKGGNTGSPDRLNKFSLSNELIFLVADRWVEIKENNGYSY